MTISEIQTLQEVTQRLEDEGIIYSNLEWMDSDFRFKITMEDISYELIYKDNWYTSIEAYYNHPNYTTAKITTFQEYKDACLIFMEGYRNTLSNFSKVISSTDSFFIMELITGRILEVQDLPNIVPELKYFMDIEFDTDTGLGFLFDDLDNFIMDDDGKIWYIDLNFSPIEKNYKVISFKTFWEVNEVLNETIYKLWNGPEELAKELDEYNFISLSDEDKELEPVSLDINNTLALKALSLVNNVQNYD